MEQFDTLSGQPKDSAENTTPEKHPSHAADTSLLSVCGTDCSTCYCYPKMCSGCNMCSGKVFHSPEGQGCAIYACTVHNKGLKNCGECSEAPCDIWMRTRDPKYSDEEFAETIRMRMETLKNIQR